MKQEEHIWETGMAETVPSAVVAFAHCANNGLHQAPVVLKEQYRVSDFGEKYKVEVAHSRVFQAGTVTPKLSLDNGRRDVSPLTCCMRTEPGLQGMWQGM